MSTNQPPQEPPQPLHEPDVTNEPAVLLGIYSAQSDARMDYNERKWETVRSASLLTLGLLAGVGAIATVVQQSRLALELLGFSLWVFGIAIFFWTNYNLKRESKLQYAVEFSMYQIEKLLGAHGVVPSDLRWLPTYTYIFDKKHMSYKYNAKINDDEMKQDPIEAWVNGRMNNTKENFLKTVNAFSWLLLAICFWVGLMLLIFSFLGPASSTAITPSITPTMILNIPTITPNVFTPTP